MREAGAGRHGHEREWMRHPPPASPEEHLPQVGMEVAGYRLETRLGQGGQGTVFRARREGRLFAVKFIFLPRAAQWAWRELDVMVKLWRAGGLPLEGHGQWPARNPLFLFIVTPFVRGRPLDAWAREHNPSAREVAEQVRRAASQLAVVHAAGVVHRDVKGANLLVCEDGLVLVDFGVATYEGAPGVTGPFPPGTWPYLSPRVWRAWRGEEASRASPEDDVWALGVELYQLLTGRLPFQGSEGELVRAILHEEPEAPHVVNPRVPRALGALCQRMLRKEPGERYADTRAVETALEEALKQADAAWDAPLCEAWSLNHATTERERGLWEGAELLALYERLSSYERHTVRGRPRPPDEASTQGAPGEPPPGHEAPEPSAARPRWRLRTAAVAALVLLGLGVWLARPTTPPEETRRAASPAEFLPLPWDVRGQEVAPPWKRLEGDGGAAPEAATTPAPVAHATPSEDMRVKTPAKAPAHPKSQPKEPGTPASTVGMAVLACTLATGCPSPAVTSQARPPHPPLPPPAECPPGAAKAMKALGLLRPPHTGNVELANGEVRTLVRPGPVTLRLAEYEPGWGALPTGTLFFGELLFGERIQGRFTQAQTPDGSTYPVCLELREGPDWGWSRLPDSTPDTARVVGTGELDPVESLGAAWRYEEKEKR